MSKIRTTPCGKYFLTIFFVLTIAIIILYIFTNYDSVHVQHRIRTRQGRKPVLNKKTIGFQGEKIVHLDLKGAPPKVSYYKKLFPLLSKMGATGLLMEYEDMFSYNGGLLENISAYNAYSLSDIKLINKYAAESQLKLIPLVQTFGHMEFLLKLFEFKEYREEEPYPSVICPSHENTLNLLTDMIVQVVEAHPDSKFIHIGSDEVYYLGMCDKCKNVMASENLSKNMLFIKHVKSVIKIIKSRFPDLRVLMWDDEFRSATKEELKKSKIGNMVEPVVWKYTKDVMDDLGPSLWDMYSDAFPKIWVASAFKGATGSNQYIVDVPTYLQNHRSWMDIISFYKDNINFEGIIITGWQRYDHFAVLCELLPIGLPSLAMSLRIVQGYMDSPLTPPLEIADLLHCEQPYALIASAFGTPKCNFPGGSVLESVLHLHQLKMEFQEISTQSQALGWMDGYNIEHKYSSPQYVEVITLALVRIKGDLGSLDEELTMALQEVYDNYTVSEWKDTYFKPFEISVNELWKSGQALLSKEYWPRRPLDYKNEL
ncbi:unnamed protein product [Brassicogethes aeneus]|uniref:beta-N-acetylhexosaminidase n=1 Tax=Brassicogethes aeneus TaxID=1431903 RepID=A0A9P0B6L8_BRAAE|nr:unnamed protein product [Brassicogethes aeneus]